VLNGFSSQCGSFISAWLSNINTKCCAFLPRFPRRQASQRAISTAFFVTKLSRYFLFVFLINQIAFQLCLAAATIERINISRNNEKLFMLVDSNWPIQYEFDTKKNGRTIAWTLKGADYYKALTDYFTAFDIDSLLDCMDNLVIVPLDDKAARFEADLGPGLTASVFESQAPNGSYRMVMQVNASAGTAPCFRPPIPAALVAEAGLFDAPTAPASKDIAVTSTPSLAAAATALAVPTHELTAEEIVKAEEQRRKKQMETAKANRRLIGLATDAEVQEHFEKEMAASRYLLSAELLFDKLNYSKKGGIKGVNWLQKYGDSEIRQFSLGIANELARFPYHLSLNSYTQYVKDGVRVDQRKVVINRARVGFRLNPAFTINAGIMYEPNNSDSSSDLGALPFLEKGLSTYLSAGYNPGVLLSYHGSSFSFDVGGFGQRSEMPDTSKSTSIRLAYSVRTDITNITTFDFAYSKAKLVDDQLVIAATPEANLILPLMYLGSQTNIDSMTRSGLGVIWIYHGFNYAAHTAQINLDTPNTGITQFSSKNLWFTWFSGDDHRRLHGAKFLPLRSKKSLNEIDWKSWEMGFRYSSLEDNTEEHLITKTLVLNWYVNQFVTIKNDYIFATQVASPNDPGRPIDNDADLFLTRLQISW